MEQSFPSLLAAGAALGLAVPQGRPFRKNQSNLPKSCSKIKGGPSSLGQLSVGTAGHEAQLSIGHCVIVYNRSTRFTSALRKTLGNAVAGVTSVVRSVKVRRSSEVTLWPG